MVILEQAPILEQALRRDLVDVTDDACSESRHGSRSVSFPPPGWLPHVLVVDDDPSTVSAVRAVLEVQATVVGVPDVYQALDHIEQERVDLLLFELFLPGASGVDLLRRLAGGPRPSRVIALTHASSVARLAPDLTVDGVLHKPPVPEALREALQAAALESRLSWLPTGASCQ
jgi:CheY-like chemotaxis protein